jgi:Fungal Zn(2)-Cys(6) binuclear cluster domain
MEGKRYAISRKKACQHCSSVKAKCDLKDGGCSRCARRKLLCVYPRASASRHSTRRVSSSSQAELDSRFASRREPDTDNNTRSSIVEPLRPPSRRQPDDNTRDSIVSMHAMGDTGTNNAPLSAFNGSHNSTLYSRSQLQALDFSALELICPINANDISNRWLNTYVPLPGQKPKNYPASITAFLYRIFKSYAAVTVHGHELPPFVHFSQVSLPSATTSPPLSTCLNLVRICEKPLPGSEHVAADVLQREMDKIFEQRGAYDDMALLAAFQAYLIYCLVLFFNLNRGSDPFLRQAMVNLQELACSSSHRGLVCTAEEQHARPKWEAWIVAEAKRRTLYAMYLFDSILSSQDGLPTFLGTELYGLLAPTGKYLWRAQTRVEWERAYNIYLTDWVNGGLYIHELWPMPADLDESGVLEIRRRVDQWLGDVDEYGTMMYAVTSCTHGG